MIHKITAHRMQKSGGRKETVHDSYAETDFYFMYDDCDSSSFGAPCFSGVSELFAGRYDVRR